MCDDLKKDYKPRQEEDRGNNSEKKRQVANELKQVHSLEKKEKSRKELCERQKWNKKDSDQVAREWEVREVHS